MSGKRDYYKVLGIQKDASDDDIKHAYRVLAKKYHPDISDAEDAEAKFEEITEAKEILLNSDKRFMYDKYGFPGLEKGFVPPSTSRTGSTSSTGGAGANADVQSKANSNQNEDQSEADGTTRVGPMTFKDVVALFRLQRTQILRVSIPRIIMYIAGLIHLKAQVLQFAPNYEHLLDWWKFLVTSLSFKTYIGFAIGVQVWWFIWRRLYVGRYWDDSHEIEMMIAVVALVFLSLRKAESSIPWYMFIVPCALASIFKF